MKEKLKNIKISTENILLLTQIIDKMNIAAELKSIDRGTKEEVGTEIIVLIATNLYKAKDDIYDFIINYKNLFELPNIDTTIENYDMVYERECKKNYDKAIQEAKQYDFISLIKEILGINGMQDFLEQ